MLVGVLPSWVESDLSRSLVTHALGLQAVADRLADRLLPGLSVLTTRARYFTFLAWARQRISDKYDERAIHQREVALTLAEAIISDGDPTHKQDCSYVGALNVGSKSAQEFPRDRVPLIPRHAYKIPAWRAYRASMIDLGLITGGPHFSLTEQGLEAASRFRTVSRSSRKFFTPTHFKGVFITNLCWRASLNA